MILKTFTRIVRKSLQDHEGADLERVFDLGERGVEDAGDQVDLGGRDGVRRAQGGVVAAAAGGRARPPPPGEGPPVPRPPGPPAGGRRLSPGRAPGTPAPAPPPSP